MKALTKIVMMPLLVALGTNTAQARFLQTDPVGYDDQINLYAYVHNDPVNKVDPDGKEAACITLNTGCWGDRNDPDTAKREARAGMAMTVVAGVASSVLGPEAAIAAKLGGTALRLMRGAELFKPVASGAAAVSQRYSAVVSSLKGLGTGEGRVIAGAGAKAEFRGAEAAAKKYGGEAADYSKVSATRLTESGDRVSVHAIRNNETGRIYEPKVIYGR